MAAPKFISDADMEKLAPAQKPPAFIPDDQADTVFGPAPVTPPEPAPMSTQDKLKKVAIGAGKNLADTALGAIKTVAEIAPDPLGSIMSPLSKPLPLDKIPVLGSEMAALDKTSEALQPKDTPEKVGYYGTTAATAALPVAGAAKIALSTTKEAAAAKATHFLNKALGNFGKKSVTGLLNNDENRRKGLETLYTLTKDAPIKASDGTSFEFNPTKVSDPHELLLAFKQAKQQVWSRIQSGLERGSSVTPNYSAVKSGLQKIIDSPGSTSQARNHATNRLAEINNLERGGVSAAQEFLQQLNSRLGATFSGASDAIPNQIDAQVAHGVNGALDEGLSRVTDASVRPFKDQYAALKSIEPDIAKMVQKTLRQNGKGIPQYINDFGNIDIFDAIFAHNPGLYVARGIGKKVLARILGGERDPLANLSKAFKAVESYMGGVKPTPEAPTLALPPGTRGAPSEVRPNGQTLLPERSQSTLDWEQRRNPDIRQPENNLEGPKLLRAPGENPIQLPAAAPAAAVIPAAFQEYRDPTNAFPTDRNRTNTDPLHYERGGKSDPLSYVRKPSAAPVKPSPKNYVIAGVDIAKWATDPDHEKKVTRIYSSIPATTSPEDVQSYITKRFPNSPITGDDVWQAANKHGIDPRLLIAMMQQDSSLGTAGLGKKTNNPANVGNDDAGNKRRFKTMRDGVNAAAALLAKYKVQAQTASAATSASPTSPTLPPNKRQRK